MFLDRLKAAHTAGRLRFFGSLADLNTQFAFDNALKPMRKKSWVVYAKPPFGSPQHVLAYLGRYTHRVAIANRPTSAADLAIMRRIDELHLNYPFAGSRMLRDLLGAEGTKVGRLHVATLMRKMAITAIYRQPNTSKPAAGHKIYPYASDGSAPIDNNLLERDIRVFVTGRKNWLFSDTIAGAKASATIYSLMLTCRACGVDPHDWLAHVLTELPQRGPDAEIEDLFPFNFAAKNAATDENTI